MVPIELDWVVDEESGELRPVISFRKWREFNMKVFNNWNKIIDLLKMTPEYAKQDVTTMKLIQKIEDVKLSGILLTTALFDTILIDESCREKFADMVAFDTDAIRNLIQQAESGDEEDLPDDIKDRMCEGGTA
jgi:hypothetical protein